MIKVIIFDLDGLLIDSQPLQYEAYNSVFSKYGAPMSLKDWYSWVHKGWHSKNWIEKNNLPLQTECVVIEDSVAGLKAAKGAGMRCIICPDTFIHVDPSEFIGAYKIVETLDEVIFGMIEERLSELEGEN